MTAPPRGKRSRATRRWALGTGSGCCHDRLVSELDDRLRLGRLIVEALEVGSGKHEVDVSHEIFAALGLDLAAIERSVDLRTPDRASVLREQAGQALADAGRSTGEIINTLLRIGGRFVAMLEEVYDVLDDHAATTTGTNESYRVGRGEIDETALYISPAFSEQVRHLEAGLSTIPTGRVDNGLLSSFVGFDNGEPGSSRYLARTGRSRCRLEVRSPTLARHRSRVVAVSDPIAAV